MSTPTRPQLYQDLLFLQWVYTLAQVELGVTQFGQSGDNWQFTREPGNYGISVAIQGEGDVRYVVEATGGASADQVSSVCERAHAAMTRDDVGEGVWFQSGFVSAEPDLLGNPTQFVRNMGDQRFISGWRRISDDVLVEFSPEGVDNPSPLNAPKTEMRVLIRLPGGGSGPFSSKLASDVLEFVRLICAFALGRPIAVGVGTAFPADEAAISEAESRQQDHENVQTLARNGVSLDPFAHLASLGGEASVVRYRGALVAFDAAMEAKNPDVATILFVSSIEALLSPETEWRRNRLAARFIRSVREYALSSVDSLLQHPNMERALGFSPKGGPSKRRRDILSHIYELRSAPVHAGPAMAMGMMGGSLSHDGQIRVGLLSDLAQGVILGYLTAPHSSLVGHPDVDPAIVQAAAGDSDSDNS